MTFSLGAACIVGGNDYGRPGTIRSALAALPPATPLILTSTLGVSRMAATFASLLSPPLPHRYVLWKRKPGRLTDPSLAISLFLIFADGTQDYRFTDDGWESPGLLTFAARASIPVNMYLPDGILSQNPFDDLAALCSTRRRSADAHEDASHGRSGDAHHHRTSGYR